MQKQGSSPGAVAITGRGLASSLGCDVTAACAAARAGIVRPAPIEHFRYRSPESGRLESAVGHPIQYRTTGFEGFGRLLRLAEAGMSDLQRQVADSPWMEARTAFYLSLPDPQRRQTGLEAVRSEETRRIRSEKAQSAAQQGGEAEWGARLLRLSAVVTEWPKEVVLAYVSAWGHAGVAEAVARAIDDLRAGRIEVALVLGVDSLLDEDTLQWLESMGRLKRTGVPAGLQPGEAAAFIQLETLDRVLARGGRVLATVRGVELGQDEDNLLKGRPALGSGITEVISTLVEKTGLKEDRAVWLVTDQNGEPFRATEWGNALIRLMSRHAAFRSPLLWYPAASFGDTGAASGAVSLCVATSAFERGYSPAHMAVILSSADGPHRAAVLVEAFSGSSRAGGL